MSDVQKDLYPVRNENNQTKKSLKGPKISNGLVPRPLPSSETDMALLDAVTVAPVKSSFTKKINFPESSIMPDMNVIDNIGPYNPEYEIAVHGEVIKK